MIKLILDMDCCVCGKPFIYEKEYANNLEKEIAGKRLGKAKMKCRDCFIAEKKQAEAELIEALKLPVIQGASEKQVQYANVLRSRYVMAHIEKIKYAQQALLRISPDKLYSAASKRGLSILECIPEAFRRMDLQKEFICLTFTDARQIIDSLKISP